MALLYAVNCHCAVSLCVNFFKQKSYKLSFEYYCVGVSIEINCLGVTEVFVIQEQGKLKKLG